MGRRHYCKMLQHLLTNSQIRRLELPIFRLCLSASFDGYLKSCFLPAQPFQTRKIHPTVWVLSIS
ncbi:hypothetical protein Hanom_Chr09g00830071 [Helianthus anomalus]